MSSQQQCDEIIDVGSQPEQQPRFCYDDIENQQYDIEEFPAEASTPADDDGEYDIEEREPDLDDEKIEQIEQMIQMNIGILKLYVNRENHELFELYREHIENHNTKMSNEFPDSGFDLFIPEKVVFDTPFETKMIDLQIKAEMVYHGESSAFNIFPRSSISKTPLMLANHTGVIDQGYRGWLMGAFRWLYAPPDKTDYGDENPKKLTPLIYRRPVKPKYVVEKHTRLLQICHPSLCPVVVILIHYEADFTNTSRNDGGFGSTGIVGKMEPPAAATTTQQPPIESIDL